MSKYMHWRATAGDMSKYLRTSMLGAVNVGSMDIQDIVEILNHKIATPTLFAENSAHHSTPHTRY